MNSPLISIITPVYKGENTIIRAVKSSLQQDFPDWEMIIISDDNQDYYELLTNNNIVDSRLQFTSTSKIKSGSSNARNKGLEMAKGKYIACLDADDVFKCHKLSTLIPLVEKYGAAVSSIEIRDNYSDVLLENFSKPFHSDCLSPQDLPWVCIHTCSVYLCDRSKITDLFYDNDLPRMQDFIFLMSFFNKIDNIGFEISPLHIYYKREGSSCNSSDTHELFHKSKKNLLNKVINNQISLENDLAREEVKKIIGLSLEIDDIYDREVINNPNVDWEEILKREIKQRKIYDIN